MSKNILKKEEVKRKVYVVGHLNPDTDSICSAIAYANLKNHLPGASEKIYEPRRAGQINEETQHVLKSFGLKPPKLLSNLRVQVKDVDLRKIEGVKTSVPIKRAWEIMKEEKMKTLPVTRDSKLEGLITVGDIATSYMDVHDSTVLSEARTQYRNISNAVDGRVLQGNHHGYFQEGKVAIAASGVAQMKALIEKDDLVIMGNVEELELCAVDINVSCMVICRAEKVEKEILKKAAEKEIVVIATPHDVFTTARLINQSIPVKYFMTKDHLVSFHMDEYVDDVREIMTKKKFRDFPILDAVGNFEGFISRRRLLKARKKQVILVDHNEKAQAVDGIDEAEVLEIIDHHRLSSIETMGPVFFRNQPVGCTGTIVYQMYQEEQVEIEPKMAGILCAAILSDTLMFRSPTCTPLDEAAARRLAEIAGIDVEEFAYEMFNAGSNLGNKTAEEICFLDFKQFQVGDTTFGVGQVNSMSATELGEIKKKVESYLDTARSNHGLNMIYLMLTNIVTESTELLCAGDSAREQIIAAYDMPLNDDALILKGVVSRKKQLLPTLVGALQQ
ncbi:inorganic pyrophosphatase [Mediterraneibacter butyricigenes]|uniref:inorganic diphosphatase n=1 Tax=Mediterraneibacter butyricigenes TaxID=2316025 RepID=A0A391NYI6_9FIRM|nr:putative manganese-dependent inorganic diphosphatase [Mediterraneibacter butyricigenes]RGV95420.1 putative manganese-dependent inorganic diphosphatase [Ruminococcus sp. AF14-10]GCA65937.1 inorganic pyrophosphatase [Mediterraneibacter butyricigenes]